MFLFLSKLLPLFIYPIGFSCICLIVTLFTFYKRPRVAQVSIALALTVLLLGSNGWVADALVRSLEQQNVPTGKLPKADAIVVLGGATRAATAPRPWVDVSEAGDRPLYAAYLYQRQQAPLIVLSGGRVDWKDGGPSEAEDMAQLIEAMGVPAKAIRQERTSLNTYQNAVNVKPILEAEEIDQFLLVTSAMHMPRSLAIFRKQGMNAIAAPTDFLIVPEESSLESFLLNLFPDASNMKRTTLALKEYIGLCIYKLRGWL